MTVHYHGSPIWGDENAPTDMLIKALYRDGGAFISFARPEQMKKVAMFPCDIRLDNGAYSAWDQAKKKKITVDWESEVKSFMTLSGNGSAGLSGF
ncbi:hypothetical protein [Atlantibacter hermannii]|uniref:hypothetical protein n=1 Tax=Atlantibacter hermannii TaxID=565 RepID=UPI00291012F3|nr:hypothetical protein [Atlantibacter hermannii]MDU7391556.1 hypothetical protein [Atlantibacter hermannii]